jgi:beta-N-acetylhexosaminidase
MQNTGFILMDFQGPELSTEDLERLKHPAVAGVVLFRRNYENKAQLKALCNALKNIKPMIISVDQEGGRVQRFREGFSMIPAMRHWGEMYQDTPELAKQELYRNVLDSVRELQEVGINLNLMPVLDIDQGKSWVIGGRSFYSKPEVVNALADTMISAMKSLGMPVVGKHYPGHGGVEADSHHQLPIDTRSFDELWELDLKPFSHLAHRLDGIMPAHVVYEKCDPNPAGYSEFWLQDILRGRLGFSGVIMSDDLSMKAAISDNDMRSRADSALKAGCDLLIICNDREGLDTVLENSPPSINPESVKRVQEFMNHIKGLT